MGIDSRDSDTLKPPELDELGQILTLHEGFEDSEIDRQVEHFPLVVMAGGADESLDGFLFGSLERIGGTPCVLWGLGATPPGRAAKKTLAAMADELFRRAAITFPDEDVLVGGRFNQPGGYSLLDGLSDRVPRPGYKATGEERAWGRRLAKRFGCEDRYDDQVFTVQGNGCREPVIDSPPINGGGKAVTEIFSVLPDDASALIAFGWALAEDLARRGEL